jgi:predicted RNase H-like nuclease
MSTQGVDRRSRANRCRSAMVEGWVAGVDGCRGGWVVMLREIRRCALVLTLCERFSEVLALPQAPAIIAVDIPIGLLPRRAPGGRECDRAARYVLGRDRQASVFTPSTRAALRAMSYAEAIRLGGGLSRQAYGILPKIREVDCLMSPARQQRVYECHPELAFSRLAGVPLRHNKKSADGRRQRLRLLHRCFGRRFVALTELRKGIGRARVKDDDILDAYVLTDSAWRIARGCAARLPAGTPRYDDRGLRMEIWY